MDYRGSSANNVLQRTTPGNDFFIVWKHPHTGAYQRLSTYDPPGDDAVWKISELGDGIHWPALGSGRVVHGHIDGQPDVLALFGSSGA